MLFFLSSESDTAVSSNALNPDYDKWFRAVFLP
jgi:hypothetical protein